MCILRIPYVNYVNPTMDYHEDPIKNPSKLSHIIPYDSRM